MSAGPGTSDDPRALVPGDPAAVAADARMLAGRAAALARTGEALRRIGTGAWTGPAADAWREQHDADAARWLQGADSLDAAARALSGHADALAGAQSEAARAIALRRAGDAAADEILARARAELARSGDQVAAVLRGEAVLAPRDSQKQADLDFYGGIADSVVDAGKGLWTLVSDPAEAVVGVVQAAASPVQSGKDAIAWDDWTGGREPRALGRNTGDLILGAATLGAGKIASILGRETRIAGEAPPEPSAPETPVRADAPAGTAAVTQEARAGAVRNVVLDPDGIPRGREDSKGVYLIDRTELQDIRQRLHAELGEPDSVRTPKGERETWMIGTSPRAYATYRTYSASGGATIDVTGIDGLPVKRFHIDGGGS